MCHVYVYVCINWTISFYVFWFFYVYEFRRIQSRGEFNIYFRRSRDFFQSMVIP